MASLLLLIHGKVHSWALTLFVLALLVEITRILFARLVPSAALKRRKAFERLNPTLGSVERQVEMDRLFPIPSWHIWWGMALLVVDIALRACVYTGLYLALRNAPALRGQPLLWWSDMTARFAYVPVGLIFYGVVELLTLPKSTSASS